MGPKKQREMRSLSHGSPTGFHAAPSTGAASSSLNVQLSGPGGCGRGGSEAIAAARITPIT
jgi:hypothetical protein